VLRNARILSQLSILALATQPLRADAGVPMVAVTWPGMLALLVPIILIENYILARHFGQHWKQTFSLTVVPNLFSMILGIPLSWFVFYLLEALLTFGIAPIGKTLLSPVLRPGEPEYSSMALVACLISLPHCFFVSWVVETWIAYQAVRPRFLALSDSKQEEEYPLSALWPAMFKANIASYIFLGVCCVAWLFMSPANQPKVERRPEPAKPAHAVRQAGVDSPKETIRIEFVNPQRKRLAVRVVVVTDPSTFEADSHSSEIWGDANCVIGLPVAAGDRIYYRTRPLGTRTLTDIMEDWSALEEIPREKRKSGREAYVIEL